MKLPILAISVRKLLRLGALALVVGLMHLGGNQAQATGHVTCGDVLTTPTTLDFDLGVCPGPDPALTIVTGGTLKCTNNAILSGDGKGLGIFLDNVSGVGETVKNCDIRHFSIGILLSESTGNTLKNNEVTGSTSRGSGGITLVKDSDKNTLLNNTANDNNGRGIALNNASNNELKNNRVGGNNFRGIGIVHNSNDNILTNNRAINNDSAGYVVYRSTGNLLEKNRSTGSEYEGFAFLQATGNTFTGNTAKGNGTFGYRDNTTGTGTLGTANDYNNNKCTSNKSGGSSPTGLCTPQP